MTGIVWPNGSKTIPRVSSEFNPARRHPITGAIQPHNGIDLVGFEFNHAPEDGRVTLAGYNGGAGIEVRIVADGPTAFHRGTTYRILHNAPNSLRVSVGQRVTAGQIVARQGTTGQSTGVHTHFETHPGSSWNPVNPRGYMAAALASPAGGGGNAVTPKPPAPPAKMEDEDMDDRIVNVRDKATNGQGTVYAVDRVTGKKRPISQAEWAASRAQVPGLAVTDVTAAQLNAIPNA